jgi:peptidoglycan/LPS O-acetylase OafA/YrhL
MGLIRFYLAFSVTLWHVSYTSEINGYLAVICFYVMSGYYMSMVLNESYRGPGATLRFYAARYLRLFPPYLVILLLSCAFFALFDSSRLALPPFAGHPFSWFFTIFSNTTMFGLDVLKMMTIPQLQWPFDPSLPRIVPQGWSLGTELLFYLLAPFVVRRSLKVSVFVLVACIAVRMSLLSLPYDPWRYYFTPSVFCFFIMGHLSHRLGVLFNDSAPKRWIGLAALLVLPFLGYFAGVYLTREVDRPDTWIFLVLFTAALPFVFALTKDSSVDSMIGNLSYPLYLAHRLIFAIILLIATGTNNLSALKPGFTGEAIEFNTFWTIHGLIGAVLAAAMLHLIVERPVESIRGRIKTSTFAHGPRPPIYGSQGAELPSEGQKSDASRNFLH